MAYSLKWDKRAHKELKKIDQKFVVNIVKASSKLSKNPHQTGKRLHGDFKYGYSLRVGNYRILYQINDHDREVIIFAIGHRKDIYR